MIRRTNTASGAYLLKRAEALARSIVARFGKRTEVIDGYIVEGKRVGEQRIATVLDTPCQVVSLDNANDPRGNTYSVGTRDAMDPRTGLVDGPYTLENTAPSWYPIQYRALGFSMAEGSPWAQSIPWRKRFTSQRDAIRAGMVRIKAISEPFPYDVTEQMPVGTQVFAGVEVYPNQGGQPSWVLSEAVVDRLAPGYLLFPRTNLGYMTWQYNGQPPTTAGGGGLTLVVAPIVTGADPNNAAHWGHSALLFILLDPGQTEDPVVWSRVWSPDSHSVSFFHNGPWIRKPAGTLNSPYINPANNWDTFWANWGAAGNPEPAGGSRPNWIDGITAAWFNGRFVVNARIVAVNGALGSESDSYPVVGGWGHMRFTVDLDGAFTVAELGHDLLAFKRNNPALDAPYDTWVPGTLDPATVYLVAPLCTLATENVLVEARLRMEGDRTRVINIQNALSGAGYPTAILASGRLEVAVTTRDEAGESTATHTVYFDSLGVGLVCPTAQTMNSGSNYALYAATSSYKLWPADQQFALISDHELAFICHEQWHTFIPRTPSPLTLAVLDLRTGEAELRGAIGISHGPDMTYATPAHLDCIQRVIRDEQGRVVIDAVLLASSDDDDPVRISRDGGRTWADYLNFPRPAAGAYFIGNPLRPGYRPGAAIA